MTSKYNEHRSGHPEWQNEMAATSEEPSATSVDFERLWRYAFNLRYWLIGILILACLLGIAVTLLQTPQYRATSRIEISRVDSGGSDVQGISIEGEARDLQYYQTQYTLLQSRFLAERVVEAENLVRNSEFRKVMRLEGEGKQATDIAVTRLLSRVKIEPIKTSNLVDISVSTPSAALSALLANAWAQQFLEANYAKRFGHTIQARNQLENQLAELREKLETSEAALINYANNNEIVVISSAAPSGNGEPIQQTLVATQLAELNAALSAATVRRIAAESAVQAGPAGGKDTLDRQQSLRARMAETQARLNSLRTSLGREHPQVVALEAELSSLRSSLGQDAKAVVSSRGAELRRASLEEGQLRQRFEAARNAYFSHQRGGVQYGILKREVDTNRELYNALLQRYKELGVAGTGSNNMAIIERARVPNVPFSPVLGLNLAIALVGGILICASLVVLRSFFDQSVGDPAEVRRQLGLQVLGMIPSVDNETIKEQLADSYSILSEAYSSARVSLSFVMPDEGGAILITSTYSGEGKTLSSLALAHNLAKIGQRVALVDLDLRRLGLSKLLGIRASREGMAAFLSGTVEKPDIVTMDQYGFDFIPGGGRPENPANLLASPRVKGLIDQLKQTYDYVIVDGAPVLGLADAPELGQTVDGVIYVIKANAGTFRAIRNGLGRLRGANTRMLGAIVTQLDRRNDHYGYGYGYGYGYEYGEASGDTDR